MSDYKDDLLQDLKDSSYAVQYLSAAYADSPEAFLVALRDVADAQLGMKRLAVVAGVNRENLYRMLSEEGNPRFASLRAVLDTLDVGVRFEKRVPSVPSTPQTIELRSAEREFESLWNSARSEMDTATTAGNASGGYFQSAFTSDFRLTTLAVRGRKPPGKALDNPNSVGHSIILEQTGGSTWTSKVANQH